MATKQQVNDFINTAPESGEARFLWSGSTGADTSVTASVVGMTISIFDCNGNSRAESISNLSLFTIGSDTLSTFNKQDKTNYFYYEVVPTVTGSLADAEGACTETSLTPPPKITTFKNSEYNAVFNNAVNIRRIERYETGSSGFSNGVFELVKTNSQLTPQNLNAVMSGSAATASFQESNIYSKSWTLPRYEGSKLSSGSLFYNDPALSFKGFNAIKYKLTESSSAIRSQSNVETELFYFNPPFATLRSGLRGYFQGSETDIPPSSQPVYELVGKEFKRITKSKLYLPNTDDVIRVEGYQAFYEANPSTNPGVQSGDNIFTVMIETLDNQDFYRYYNEFNTLVGPFELRAGDGADVIKVSGSYIASLNEYALDVIDSGRTNAAIINDGRNELTNVKTFYEILSSSNKLE
jgi:hypothetical protein